MTLLKSASAPADGLAFIPVRGRALSHGYYLARRRSWSEDSAWAIVFVYELEDEGRTRLGVFQTGSEEPDDPRQWVFRSRLMGLCDLPTVLPPHPRVQLADIVH